MIVRGFTLALLLVAAAACSSHRDEPGAVSSDEARQLNEAAAMLDANSLDANAAMADGNEGDTQ